MVNGIEKYTASRKHYMSGSPGSSGRSRGRDGHGNERTGSVFSDRHRGDSFTHSRSSKYPSSQDHRMSKYYESYERKQGRKFDGRGHIRQENVRNGGRSRSSRDSDYSSGSSETERREHAKRKHYSRDSYRSRQQERSGVGNDDRPPLTAEQLDAELDAYMAEVKKLRRKKQKTWRV